MYTEHQLYTGCYNGDELLRRQTFKRYLPMLHAVSRRYCTDEAEAEDLTQESFIRAFQYIGRFSWNGDGSFEKWLNRVFINNAINAYKKRQRSNEVRFTDVIEVFSEDQSMFSDDDPVMNFALDHLSYGDIIECIKELPDQFRIVFNLFAIEELKHKEIAELLNIPIKTSTTRYMRAKTKLREIVEQKLQNAETASGVQRI